MAVIKEEFLFPSAAGDCDIHAISWKPKGKSPKAVIQFVHGMAEYIDRYDSMARYFAEQGYAVYGNDHLGHGKSVNQKCPLGYFGTENRNGAVFVKDMKQLTDLAKTEFPGQPFFLFGHSMGSFLSRVYLSEYGEGLDGAIICGTAGPNPAAGFAVKLADAICKRHAKDPGVLLNKLAFSTYNARTRHYTSFDWLSKDQENVRVYVRDPLCGFLFSNQGFSDLLTLNQYIFSDAVIENCPKNLPMFFISGTGDPVGTYGKGVKKTVRLYRKSGHKKVSVKLYRGSRHEIHNDIDKVDVFKDMDHFMQKILTGKARKH